MHGNLLRRAREKEGPLGSFGKLRGKETTVTLCGVMALGRGPLAASLSRPINNGAYEIWVNKRECAWRELKGWFRVLHYPSVFVACRDCWRYAVALLSSALLVVLNPMPLVWDHRLTGRGVSFPVPLLPFNLATLRNCLSGAKNPSG